MVIPARERRVTRIPRLISYKIYVRVAVMKLPAAFVVRPSTCGETYSARCEAAGVYERGHSFVLGSHRVRSAPWHGHNHATRVDDHGIRPTRFLCRFAEDIRMTLNLDDAEWTALRELLTEAIRGTNYAVAPRPRQFTSILRKLVLDGDRTEPTPIATGGQERTPRRWQRGSPGARILR